MSKNRKKVVSGVDLSNSDFKKSADFKDFKRLYEEISEKYNKIISKVEDSILVPVSIFNYELGPLETVVKYLKENLSLSNKQISVHLKRSEKTVWQAYNFSKKKLSEAFQTIDYKYMIPVEKLSDRKYSVFENIVVYLRSEFSLSYQQIAKLLKRDYQTVWTLDKRAKVKREK